MLLTYVASGLYDTALWWGSVVLLKPRNTHHHRHHHHHHHNHRAMVLHFLKAVNSKCLSSISFVVSTI